MKNLAKNKSVKLQKQDGSRDAADSLFGDLNNTFTRNVKFHVGVFCLLIALLIGSFGGLPLYASESAGKILVIKVHDDVEAGLSFFIQRQLRRAEKENINAIILEINSNGGLVKSAQEIKDALLNSKVTTVAYIKGRALSAAALIAISCHKIFMEPDATMGAATPMAMMGAGVKAAEEKFVSAFKAEFRSSAEARHRDGSIAEAMVDVNHDTIEGLSKRGTILTLSAEPALNIGYCDKIVSNIDAALRALSAEKMTVEYAEPTSAETVARFLTNPQISTILFTLGFWCLVIEFIVPGFGLPGITGLLLLSCFFGGHLFAYLAGLEAILLFVTGMILIALEIFVVPGFGLTGISGIVALAFSVVMTFGGFYSAITAILSIVAYSFFIILVLYWFSPKIKAFDRFILKKSQPVDEGYVAVDPSIYTHLERCEGVTLSVCRPSGIARFGDERYDVLSDGDFIEKGERVIVRKVEGTKIVVRKIEE
jgi:membrane-bound serine protease (ClpP class)